MSLYRCFISFTSLCSLLCTICCNCITTRICSGNTLRGALRDLQITRASTGQYTATSASLLSTCLPECWRGTAACICNTLRTHDARTSVSYLYRRAVHPRSQKYIFCTVYRPAAAADVNMRVRKTCSSPAERSRTQSGFFWWQPHCQCTFSLPCEGHGAPGQSLYMGKDGRSGQKEASSNACF